MSPGVGGDVTARIRSQTDSTVHTTDLVEDAQTEAVNDPYQCYLTAIGG